MRYANSTVTMVALALLLGCASANSQQPPQEPPAEPPEAELTSSIENTPAVGALSTEVFATRDARMSAEPLDWNATRGEVSAEALSSVQLSDTPPGPPDSTAAGSPDPQADAEAQSLFADQWQGMRDFAAADSSAAADFVNFGTQDVFTQYCENCGSVNFSFPQRAAGKLFTNGGTCSASVVSPNNVIVTAAHCCWDRGAGNWIGGWTFAPAYRDGFAPYGTFNWSSATILNRWINVGDRRSDVCVIKLANNAAGHGVTFYTGWFGRSWNFSTTQVHHSLGYPGNVGGGNKLELCVSESFNPSGACGGATVLNTGCSMTFGASGGPWVRHYRNGSWVNSVVSGYDGNVCTGSFGATYNGPRFTTDNIVTLCNAIGC